MSPPCVLEYLSMVIPSTPALSAGLPLTIEFTNIPFKFPGKPFMVSAKSEVRVAPASPI